MNSRSGQASDMLSARHVLRTAVAVLALALAAPSQAAETIKLGFIGPLSGGNALQGQGARNGFLLAIDQAMKAGYPYKVEGVVLDDASDPPTGVSAALKLVNDPAVVATIGHWNSPVALATTPVFNRYQMPMIVWGAISPKITEANLPMVTRVTPTLTQENQPLAGWISEKLGLKKLAIVSDTSDYGSANTASFSQYFKSAGGTIVSVDAAPVGTTDFRPILTKIKSSTPEGIYFGGVITEAGLVRRQMMELGLNVPMFGISGIFDPKLIEVAGDAANGTMVGVPKVQSNPRLEAFNRDYGLAKFSEPAGSYAKYAYEATNILLAVIKEHGPKDKAALAKAIRAIDHAGILGKVSFDGNGQTQMAVQADYHVVKAGSWQPWSP